MPEDPLFSITLQDILSALSRRTNISKLTPEEIELACQEAVGF